MAERFASGLAGFWDPQRRDEYYFLADLREFESTARERNVAKQAGLYVDRSDESITTPLDIPHGDLGLVIQRAAPIIEMQLIEDHTRQQDAPPGAPIDSSQELHWAILPYAHPDEYLDFVDRDADRGAECETSSSD